MTTTSQETALLHGQIVEAFDRTSRWIGRTADDVSGENVRANYILKQFAQNGLTIVSTRQPSPAAPTEVSLDKSRPTEATARRIIENHLFNEDADELEGDEILDVFWWAYRQIEAKAPALTAEMEKQTKTPPGHWAMRCIHRYEDGDRYNIPCNRGLGNYDLCEVADCPAKPHLTKPVTPEVKS